MSPNIGLNRARMSGPDGRCIGNMQSLEARIADRTKNLQKTLDERAAKECIIPHSAVGALRR